MTEATSDVGSFAASKRGAPRRVAIVMSLVLILVAAGSALFIVRGFDTQLTDIGKTYEVRRQARELMLALAEAETGQRGYLLTLDPLYLEPYHEADARLDETYQGLVKMVADNALQRTEIDALAEPIARKREEMRQTIDLASFGRLAEALEILRSDEGREVMDKLRTDTRAFVAEEDARLVQRNTAVELPRQLLVVAVLAALAGSATLAYVLFTRAQLQVQSLAYVGSALQAQNEELEEHVRMRTVELEEARAHAERERARVEALLQDTNHRIGNSLATVSSLLGLQLSRSRSTEVRSALESAQSRVQAVASGHRRLRLGADLETTNAADFLDAVVEDIRATLPEDRSITFHTDFQPLVINARDATTLGIVLGELATNAVKHAFPDGQPGQIWMRLTRNAEGQAVLIVEDDGQGIPEEASESGLGGIIIRQLARQFGGEPEFAEREGGGARVVLTMPKLESPTEA